MKKNWHMHCPVGKESWCGFQRDIATHKQAHKHGASLPMDVIKQVKPIFEDLSNETLLKKCLHGKTQNENESYNGMIWHCIPKTILVSSTTFDVGVL